MHRKYKLPSFALIWRTFPDRIKNKFINSILTYLILSFIVFGSLLIVVTNSYLEYMERSVTEHIVEYEETDYDFICKKVDCSRIYLRDYNNSFFKVLVKEKDYLVDLSYKYLDNVENSILLQYDNIVIFKDMSFGIDFSTDKYSKIEMLTYDFFKPIFKLNPPNYILILAGTIFTFILFSVITLSYFIVLVFKSARLTDIINLSSEKAKLYSENMNTLADNISHEIKTPLTAIASNIDIIHTYYLEIIRAIENGESNSDLKRILSGCEEINCKKCAKKFCDKENLLYDNKIDESFDMIDVYIGSLFDILNKLTYASFKQMKHEKNPRSLYDIIFISLHTLRNDRKGLEFTYEISDSLKQYKPFTITNSELLHIFINHIKNSLEANTTKIEVECECKKDEAIVYLKDNGNGIPEKILNKIYEPEFSTKSTNKLYRGIGLSISKAMLIESGGDEDVVKTDSNGTVFKFIIPIEKEVYVE